MTTSENLLEMTVAAVNSLLLYDNEIDILLMFIDDKPSWMIDLFNQHVKIISSYIKDIKYSSKDSGWKCRFYRYKTAIEYKDQYDSMMICDADMFFVNNIMKELKSVAGTDKLLMPTNPLGLSIDVINDKGIECVTTCVEPPFHNMPLFFDPKHQEKNFYKVLEWGIKENYGDMITLYRTLYRENKVKLVETLNNDLWVLTKAPGIKKILMNLDEKNRPIFLLENKRINSVHRRWNNIESAYKIINFDLLKMGGQENIAKENASLFYKTIKWLIKNGPVRMDVYGK